LVVPQIEEATEGSRFDSREDIMRNATKELRSFPEMLPAVEETLGYMCGVTRGLL
jgi:hypothetical protein